jgi:hypothetical protein
MVMLCDFVIEQFIACFEIMENEMSERRYRAVGRWDGMTQAEIDAEIDAELDGPRYEVRRHEDEDGVYYTVHDQERDVAIAGFPARVQAERASNAFNSGLIDITGE